MASRLISFSITFADDIGNVSTINNIDGGRINDYAVLFSQPIRVSEAKYNQLVSKKKDELGSDVQQSPG